MESKAYFLSLTDNIIYVINWIFLDLYFSLHPSLYKIILIIFQQWQSETLFLLLMWRDVIPFQSNGEKKCQICWDKQLWVLFISPWCSWRENRVDNEKSAPIFVLLLRVNPPSLWIKPNLSFVSVYLARSLAIIPLFISRRRWARPLICTLENLGGLREYCLLTHQHRKRWSAPVLLASMQNFNNSGWWFYVSSYIVWHLMFLIFKIIFADTLQMQKRVLKFNEKQSSMTVYYR